MTLMQKRIKNIVKAMDNAKDPDMKRIWNTKLEQLLLVKANIFFLFLKIPKILLQNSF